MLLFTRKNGHKLNCYYRIDGYKLYGSKMCGIKILLGRVDIRQKRSERGNSEQSYADRFDVKVNNIKLREVNNRIMPTILYFYNWHKTI